MKKMVVYSSQSGNTEKLANTVYKELGFHHREIYTVDAAPDPDNYDYIAIGFWLQGGMPDPKTAAYLAKLRDKHYVFLFATHGAAPGSEHARQAMEHAVSLAGKAKVLGTFDCHGEVNPKVLQKVRAKPQPPDWLANAGDAVGHPNDQDLKSLRGVVRAVTLKLAVRV
jgi:flavodoxin